jgi:thioester reductase-like protein
MPQLGSVTEYLDYWASVQPDERLFSFLGIDGREQEGYTYHEFCGRTLQLATYLSTNAGLRYGDRVLLVYPPGLDLITASFACLRIGIIPVPVYPPSPMNFEGGLGKIAFIAHDCGAKAALTNHDYYRSHRVFMDKLRLSSFWRIHPEFPKLNWVVTDDAPAQSVASLNNNPHSTAFLQYTSGSTGDPKGVIVTHRNLIHNCGAVLNHSPTVVTWLPQYHDMGFIGHHLYPVFTGGSTYGFSPMNFLKRPALWLETISRVGGTITSAPNFAFDYCLREDKIPAASLQNIDLSSVRVMMSAAEPVRADTFTRFLERFSPCGLRAEALIGAYGLAENTLAVSSNGRNILTINKRQLQDRVLHIEQTLQSNNNQLRVVSCGRPLAGNLIRIVDPDSYVSLDVDHIGEIWIDGESKCSGYWQRPDLTQETFQAPISDDSSGDGRTYLRTGDLGFLHDGELYICGRIKDLIIIRGVNYYPQDIEEIVESSSPQIRKGGVAAFSVDDDGEALVVVVEVKRKNSLPDFGDIARAIRTQYYIEPDLIVLVHGPQTIPRTTSGKLARNRCRRYWLDGKLSVAAIHEKAREEESGETMTGVVNRFCYITELYNLSGREKYTFAELGMDSLTMVEFIGDIKDLLEEYGASKLTKDVDVRLFQRLTIAEFYKFLKKFERAPTKAIPVLERKIREAREEHETHDRNCMRADAKITLPRIATDTTERPLTDILLTGATGFFGPFLLTSLLRGTSYTIHVLIRARNAEHGIDRLRDSLRQARLWTDELEEDIRTRVRIVCGDLSSDNLGLETHQWESLSTEIQAICHNGAMVNYVLNYDAMKAHNVDGTRELLRLATTGDRKTFHLISSTFIFGWSNKAALMETDNNDDMANLNFGYAQTKWVAEQLVLAAEKLGLDVRIYRPSLISASTDQFGSRDDIVVRLLAFMIRHGIAVNALNQISLLPADIVADNLIAILKMPQPDANTFHITADKYYNFKDITGAISRLYGYSFRYFDTPEFIEEMNRRCTHDEPLYPLVDFFNQNHEKITAMQHKRYNSTHYKLAREQSDRCRDEPPLADTVSLIVDSILLQGIVAEPPPHDTMVEKNLLDVSTPQELWTKATKSPA